MSQLGRYVAAASAAGRLVVQPRMGFAAPDRMRAGLVATAGVPGATLGTITVDSYSRLGHYDAVRHALAAGIELNGYPIVTHPLATTRTVLTGLDIPVQVRHGSPNPERIFATLVRLGLGASEGGPVSYCLPYGRMPLAVSVRSWERGCAILMRMRDRGIEPHLETFGGCMLGQLCPPGMLVALSVLEAMFFAQHGLRCVSLSYAQQVHPSQDREAVAALRVLAERFLPGIDWHVVIYAYMGRYPSSGPGAAALLAEAVRLAMSTGAERLIVKTAAEAVRVPTIADNVAALRHAAMTATELPRTVDSVCDTGLLAEASALVEATVALHDDVGTALRSAFGRGYLDVPYCLHPDNAGRATSRITAAGRLTWADTGGLPVPQPVHGSGAAVTSAELLAALGHMRDRFDVLQPAVARPVRTVRPREMSQ